jgi:class 3 adenylate cyclase
VNSSKKLLFREPASGFATVLFCDIRGFTSLFDERDPMEALGFANTVLAVMGSIVEACGGTIDKFTGDGFLAHCGGSLLVCNPNQGMFDGNQLNETHPRTADRRSRYWNSFRRCGVWSYIDIFKIRIYGPGHYG